MDNGWKITPYILNSSKLQIVVDRVDNDHIFKYIGIFAEEIEDSIKLSIVVDTTKGNTVQRTVGEEEDDMNIEINMDGESNGTVHVYDIGKGNHGGPASTPGTISIPPDFLKNIPPSFTKED